MYYFKKDDKMSYKYNVTFDEEKVKELREKIIYKCGIKKHYEYESDSFYPNIYSGLISNYKEYPVGDYEYDTETRTIYHYSYDKIEPPYLARLIDRLVVDDSSSIPLILNYDVKKEESVDDKIDKLNESLKVLDTKDISKIKTKLSELEDLIDEKKLNENREKIDPYYKELLGLIKFDLVDSICNDEIDRVKDFLNVNKVLVKK